MPRLPNLTGYIKIIRDKSILRRIVEAANMLMTRALMAEEDPPIFSPGLKKRC